MTTDPSTRPARRRHAAAGARWLTLGLATSATTAMVTHLQLEASVQAADLTQPAVATLTAPEPAAAPPTTIVRVIQIRRHIVSAGTATAPSAATPSTPTPATPVPVARRAPAPARPAPRATTRTSGG